MADRYRDHSTLEARVQALELLITRSGGGLVTKRDLDEMEQRLMATAKEYYDEIKADIAVQTEKLGKVRADVTRLLAKIEEFQNSPGVLTAQDEALWADIRNLVKSTATDLGAVDDLTPEPPSP